jgi:NAD(P)H-nitrite reductase large subunit
MGLLPTIIERATIMHYVIIGAGPSGVTAAETIRKHDPLGQIDLLTSEPEAPYSRMAIPYYLIGNIDEQGCHLRDNDQHFIDLKINVINEIVISLNNANKTLKLSNGDTLSYDKVLIATGSRPAVPPIPGADLPMVSNCWTLQDARDIIQRAQSGNKVVLIGAGFIGSIILEALFQRGVELHVIETGNRMVPRMLNEKAGGLLKTWCIEKGVDVHTSCSVQSIVDNGDNSATVTLSNATELKNIALIITATGVKSNLELLQGSDIQLDQGILVNTRMQSSDPDVYAAGDVAQGLDFSTGVSSVQAIQPTATDHGRIAALNMAGKTTTHHGSVNMNVLDTLGLISHSFGLWMGVEDGDSAELYSPDDYKYLNLQFDDDRLVGASCSGITQHIGILRGLIESRIPLGYWKDKLLKDPTQFVEAYMACTQEIGYHA